MVLSLILANRGWGWGWGSDKVLVTGWTPDPRQIGGGTPTPDPRQIGDGDAGGWGLGSGVPCPEWKWTPGPDSEGPIDQILTILTNPYQSCNATHAGVLSDADPSGIYVEGTATYVEAEAEDEGASKEKGL